MLLGLPIEVMEAKPKCRFCPLQCLFLILKEENKRTILNIGTGSPRLCGFNNSETTVGLLYGAGAETQILTQKRLGVCTLNKKIKLEKGQEPRHGQKISLTDSSRP